MVDIELENIYFNWLYDLVCGEKFAKSISYRKVLMLLHSIEFKYTIPMDDNRYEDGLGMRSRFGYENPKMAGSEKFLQGPCSVLEMMVALALRCEETIMDDPAYGNRTKYWFWEMMRSLGIGNQYDEVFEKDVVIDIIDRFLNHEYEPNGKGGLFTLRHCDKDLRKVEIWYQLCWYLDTIS